MPNDNTSTFKAAYSVVEAGEQLGGLCRTKVNQEISAGRLEARKVGTRTLVTAEAIQTYLSQLPVIQAA